MRRNWQRSRAVLAAFVLVLSAGCQSPPPPDPPAAPAAPPQAPQAPAAPEPSEAPALPSAEQDSCHAANYATLVGQDYKQVPAAPEGKVIRVVCTTCPMTMDFNAERLNVIYDETTGLVRRLSCG